MIRVVLADDHTIIRQGLRALIERTDDISLVAECADGIEAWKQIRHHNPDVVILDIAMPRLDGLTLSARLIREKFPVSIIILTTHDEPMLHQKAISLGVEHFISKIHAFEILLETIRQAASAFGDKNAIPLVEYGPINSASFKITERERDVLRLIANGMTNRMIAEHLEISIKTVDRHRTNLMSKLGLHTSAQLSRFALQIGLA